MFMNGITFLVLAFHALGVLSYVREPKIPFDCGYSPEFYAPQVVGGQTIEPEVYSWMASLRYENTPDGVCGGSVINSRYVLTAAHCVYGQKVRQHGRLTGVRLGDFSKESCDCGTSTCRSYLHFGIADIKRHEGHFGENVILNDIALIRVSERIPFNDKLKPICLPNDDVPEPVDGDVFIVSGWGTTMAPAENVTKRAVSVPLVTHSNHCPYESASRLCAGKLSNNIFTSRTSCDGDSGGPLMKQFNGRTMVIGIVSFGNPICVNEFVATHFTRVSYFLNWIKANMHMP